MGLTGVSDWSPQLPFIDLMKQSRPWQDWDNGIEGFTVDEQGWVTELKENQTAATVFYTPANGEAMLFSRVVVLYEGEGELRYAWAARKIPHESSPGRDVVTVGANANLLKIVSVNSSNPLRNIRIIPEPYLSNYEAGEIFNPLFLERIGEFRALRFMDWMKTNDQPEHNWARRNLPESRSWNEGGVPLEVMIQLANIVDADPWFTLPHLADETYINSFASMVQQQLAAHLTVYVEHSNEVWNWNYDQAQYADVTGRARWGEEGDAFMQWHGMRTAQICDAFKQGPFSAQPARVKCVLGVQTAWHGLQHGAVECPLWVAEGNEPCYQHGVDYLGVTTYFNGGLNGPWSAENSGDHESVLRSWFDDADGGLDKAFAQLNDGSQLKGLEDHRDYAGVVDELRQEMAYWSNYAGQYQLGLVAYEGGQHITANGLAMQDDQDFIDFHIAINRDTRMQQLYKDIFNAWKDSGGQLHMCFVDFGAASKWGSWGALEYLDQPASPKWEGIIDFNRQQPCWWDACSVE